MARENEAMRIGAVALLILWFLLGLGWFVIYALMVAPSGLLMFLARLLFLSLLIAVWTKLTIILICLTVFYGLYVLVTSKRKR